MMRRLISTALSAVFFTLQAHAAGTATKIEGIGAAGTPAGGVVTVQGYPSGVPIPVTPSAPSGTQDVNLKQVNGVTVSTGAGTTGAGAQRVTAAQDTTTIAGSAPGTAGSPSANVVSVQGVGSGTTLHVTNDAGSVVIGKVGVDQTTPGTTNGVNSLQSYRASYQGVIATYAAYATPTDLVCVWGSGTKTVAMQAFTIAYQSTVAGLVTLHYVKRSTANSGGTPTNATPVALDSADAAATATVTSYASAPSTGSSVGDVKLTMASTSVLTANPGQSSLSSPVNTDGLLIGGANTLAKPLILRGVGEGVCMNFAGAALPAGFTSTVQYQFVEY